MYISIFLHFLSNLGSFGILLFRFCKSIDKDKVIMTICRRNSSSSHLSLSIVQSMFTSLCLYCTSKVYRDFNADQQTTNVWSAGRTRWLFHGPRVPRPCGLSWLRVGSGVWRRMDAHITSSQLKRTSDSWRCRFTRVRYSSARSAKSSHSCPSSSCCFCPQKKKKKPVIFLISGFSPLASLTWHKAKRLPFSCPSLP